MAAGESIFIRIDEEQERCFYAKETDDIHYKCCIDSCIPCKMPEEQIESDEWETAEEEPNERK